MKLSAKIWITFLFLSLLMIRPATSWAWWHDRGYVVVGVGYPGPYYYGGPYYPPYPRYAGFAAPDFQPVVVNGVTYYVNNGVYYIYTQYGYQSVAPPAGVSAAASQAEAVTQVPVNGTSGDSVTINVPNDKGGFSPVVLKKSGDGYVGPQGEFYPQIPSMDQLKLMYGK
jgi:hypothetical protein